MNKIIGGFGEELASDFLKRRGYLFVNKNIQLGHKEIDLVFKKEDLHIFIEVKTRASKTMGGVQYSMSSQKLKKLKRAITIYTGKYKIDPNLVRLDLIEIQINKKNQTAKIKHWKDLF